MGKRERSFTLVGLGAGRAPDLPAALLVGSMRIRRKWRLHSGFTTFYVQKAGGAGYSGPGDQPDGSGSSIARTSRVVLGGLPMSMSLSLRESVDHHLLQVWAQTLRKTTRTPQGSSWRRVVSALFQSRISPGMIQGLDRNLLLHFALITMAKGCLYRRVCPR